MKRRICLLTLLIIAIAILAWLFRKPASIVPNEVQAMAAQTNVPTEKAAIQAGSSSVVPKPAPEFQAVQARIEQAKQRQENLIALAQSPLVYFGKVVDESNQPISGVQVSYTAQTVNAAREDVFKNGTVTSDPRGIFKIDGINGIGLMLELSHPSYYPYPENSTGFDKRSVPRKGYFSDSEERAELFWMHSKGHPMSLVHRADGVNAPLNGTPTALSLRGGDYNQIIGQLVIEASGTPPPRYNQQPFDWNLKVTVPDGGLVEYTNQFDFIAPDSGYQTSVEFAFPKEIVGWTDTISKNYFVKLPSGYARLNIYVGAKRPLFFSVEYDYNPDGSRNLERAR
jgi:hypothetical protein